MKNIKLIVLTFVSVLIVFFIYFNFRTDSDKRIRIIMTGPSKQRLANFIFLYKNRIFHDDRFIFTWIYPEDEDVSKARAYIQEVNPSFIELLKIPCSVNESSVFKENKCTPFFKALFDSSSAAIFNGGSDIPPSLYGQQPLSETKPANNKRNYFNISFLHHIFQNSENGSPGFIDEKKDFPLLAICLGMQQLNVALGGTLIQDIPSLIYKDQEVEKNNIHRTMDKKKRALLNPVIIQDFIFEQDGTVGKEFVFHNHHQAIGSLGANLKATAFSADGKIIEAIRHDLYPNVIGVQFHPEYKTIWKINGTTTKNDRKFHKNFWRTFKKRIISED